MGSPLSPLLAEIFMDNLEQTLLTHKLNKYIQYYYRYVDDIIICWTGTQRQLTQFLYYANSIHNNINFTLEIETDNKLNFLDLTIERLNNRHCFSVFRKPTFTDTIINRKSHHPWSHKLAAFHSMIHRAVSLPLNKTNFHKEIKQIKKIAINNDYETKLIDGLLKKKLREHTIR